MAKWVPSCRTARRGRDVDEFDAHCLHLLINDSASGQLVGSIRLLLSEAARAAGMFYSESRFDLESILAWPESPTPGAGYSAQTRRGSAETMALVTTSILVPGGRPGRRSVGHDPRPCHTVFLLQSIAQLRSLEATAVMPAKAGHSQRLVSDVSNTEDLLQETLMRIARGLPDFDGRSSLKTWSFTIATRVAMDHFRKLGAKPATEEFPATEPPADQPSPDERLALDQMNTCVREVIAGLPAEYRTAILLYDIGELSACDCSEATAKIRIHRARTKLREALRSIESDPIDLPLISDLGKVINIDSWNTCEIYVKFSSDPSKSIIRFWQEGNLVFEAADVVATLASSNSISDRVLIGNYYNGNAPKTQSAYIDNIVVTSDSPDVHPASPHTRSSSCYLHQRPPCASAQSRLGAAAHM